MFIIPKGTRCFVTGPTRKDSFHVTHKTLVCYRVVKDVRKEEFITLAWKDWTIRCLKSAITHIAN